MNKVYEIIDMLSDTDEFRNYIHDMISVDEIKIETLIRNHKGERFGDPLTIAIISSDRCYEFGHDRTVNLLENFKNLISTMSDNGDDDCAEEWREHIAKSLEDAAMELRYAKL